MMLAEFKVEVKRKPRSNRATLRLREDQSLLVSVPSHYADSQIESWVLSNRAWIERKLAELQQLGPKRKAREYVNGDVFFLRGQALTLKIHHTKISYVTVQNSELIVFLKGNLSPDRERVKVKKLLQEWYIQLAADEFKTRTNFYAARLSVSPKSIQMKDYKRRWGVCKSSGDLIFNWRLIMAPQEILDYVVIHELCHLKVFNHSPRFWRWVETECPNHKAILKQLKILEYKGEVKL